jgi:outer membrane beta-barrel protein
MNWFLRLFFAALLMFAYSVQAEEREYTAAVQERLFQNNHEITFWGGAIPDEDFTINYPLSVSYRYHFNNHLAWEPVRATYYKSQARKLQKELIAEYGVAPSEFDYPKYSVFSSFILKPSYGKDSLFNRWILNHETHLSVGGGLVSFTKEYNYGKDTEELAWSARIAAGRKYYLNRFVALNMEVEETFSFKEEEMTNNLSLNLGLSVQFSFKQKSIEESEELKLLYEYLGDQNEK